MASGLDPRVSSETLVDGEGEEGIESEAQGGRLHGFRITVILSSGALGSEARMECVSPGNGQASVRSEEVR